MPSGATLPTGHETMPVDLLLIAGGLVALFFGGEFLVKGAIAAALKLGFSLLVISAVVVGFGTSMPELLVSVRAAIAGTPAIAIGNVIGSNTANILLIGGLAMAIAPMAGFGKRIGRDAAWMLAAATAAAIAVAFDVIPRLAGLAGLALLAVYLVTAALRDKGSGEDGEIRASSAMAPVMMLVHLAGGLALLFAGADMLVRGSVSIARSFGISEAVIGLTIVAVGTSLPELATSIVAAMRRHGDVAIGNIVGSNIFNIFGILGVTAVVAPIPVAGNFAWSDAAVMLAVTAVLSGLLVSGMRLTRPVGLVMVAAYIGYTAWLFAA